MTGPEGPSKFLVLSLELAFYEISVALQKHVEVKSDSMMCGLLCRNFDDCVSGFMVMYVAGYFSNLEKLSHKLVFVWFVKYV